MQLPIVVLKIKGVLYVLEHTSQTDFQKLTRVIENLIPDKSTHVGLDRESLKALCNLASSETDRKLLKTVATAGLSAEKAKALFGISNLHEMRKDVAQSVQEYDSIRRKVDDIVNAKMKATFESSEIGFSDSDAYSDSVSDSEIVVYDDEVDQGDGSNFKYVGIKNVDPEDLDLPPYQSLLQVLLENKFNWISFVAELAVSLNDIGTQDFNNLTTNFFDELMHKNELLSDHLKLVVESRKTYFESVNIASDTTGEMMPGGLVETDSESDDPEDWIKIKSEENEALQKKIKQKTVALQKLKKRLLAKEVAKKSFLKRRAPKSVSKTLTKYPNIGKDIEEFAKDCRIGADSWRRTGVLTFSGNTRRGQKLTFNRLKEYLEKKYNTKFGYGTIVQLCMVRNKRRLSSKRYWGAAKILSRRARKGFSVRLNVDAHWSCALYKGLDFIQLKNGCDKIILNRDDAAGFRLDTTYTHKQHRILSEAEKPELTTRTDFVNKYSSILQTTSYMFMGTDTTPEVCVGVVKPTMLYEKNPNQHAADFVMLHGIPELQSVLTDKPVECIRVDGATDEGPSHVEVQFVWTERHLKNGKLCTLVTSRFSGGSYLNRVELQNGCLAQGHSNLYIPSTIHGSNQNDSGIDKEKLKTNLDAATDVYINSVSGSLCAGNPIGLFKGANNPLSENYCRRRENLLTFLQGTKKNKELLKENCPEEFNYFNKVWTVRNNHIVKNVPENYIFMLLLCYKKNCPHPICAKGKPDVEPKWFENGPPLSYLPLPVPDSGSKTWGTDDCKKCVEVCTGHYLTPEENVKWVNVKGDGDCIQPPSATIRKVLGKRESMSDAEIEDLARKTLLKATEVKMWVDHLVSIGKRRKSGAAKAAATRKAKKSQAEIDIVGQGSVYCICQEPESPDDERFMVCCDGCDNWFHGECVNITEEEAELLPEYFCCYCS
ncbi:Chromatin modification-related YNG2 [Paramuricea clavata]|uniref:Chromatin modification-related YNG2 n=1 Tax=Paramuricea clavata TaxID=317549 RepID=A0A7D9DLE3_PARCT|nr:Chromatin modification-related YNG2 [Paramuricea clavata]